MLVINYGEFNANPSSLQEDQCKEFLSDDMSGTKSWAQTRQNCCLLFQSHFYSFTLCDNVTNFPLSPFFFFGSYLFIKFYGSIVDFLCCVGFWCITKWINYFPMSPCTQHSDAWFQLCLALSSLKIDSSASSPLSYWHTALTLALLERPFSCL